MSVIIDPAQSESPHSSSNQREVVFVDTSVADYQTLLDSIPAGAEVVLLDANADGLMQMMAWAAGKSGYDAIHVFSHGSPGTIHLGAFDLNQVTINDRALDLALLGAALKEDGDLLLYGCNVAEGATGVDLIYRLSELTKADVAGSIDRTGAADLGGDWVLEVSSGKIQTEVMEVSSGKIQTEVIEVQGYQAVLADNTAPTFSVGPGKALIPVGSGDDEGFSVIQQADGKLVAAGHSYNGIDDDFSLIRLNADGSLDTSFDIDGKLFMPVKAAWGDYGRSVILQADGKLVVAGYSTNGIESDFSLIRLNPDGSLDTAFDTDGKLLMPVGPSNDCGYSVIQQDDGKLVAAGHSFNGIDFDFSLVRLNADGSLDTSFGTDGKLIIPVGTADDLGYSVIQQDDGKLVVAGYSTNGNDYDFSLIRLNADGSLDTTFDTDGKLLMPVGSPIDFGRSVIQQADGKLVVAGYSDFDFSLIRLNTDGSLDPSFDTDGKLLVPVGGMTYGFSVIQQVDGKLVVAGHSFNGSNHDFSLIRLNADGSLDTTFDTDGKLISRS